MYKKCSFRLFLRDSKSQKITNRNLLNVRKSQRKKMHQTFQYSKFYLLTFFDMLFSTLRNSSKNNLYKIQYALPKMGAESNDMIHL